MKKITKAERRLLITSTGAIALLGSVALFRVSINAEPQVVIPSYPTAPNPNGYDVYVQAAKMIVQARPNVSEITDGFPPKTEKERAWRYSVTRKEAWLKQNAAGFATMQKAMKLSCLAPRSRSQNDDMFPGFANLRQLARDKMVEVSVYNTRGRWFQAMQSRLDNVQMGVDIPRGGALMPTFVGMAIQGIGRSKVVSEIEKLNVAESLNAAKRLETIYARRVQFTDVMTEEKYATQNQLLETMRDPGWRNIRNLNEEATWQERVRAFFISKTTIMDRVTQRCNIQIANARLPYNAPKTPLPAVQDAYTAVFAADLSGKTRLSIARNDAANAMWIVALALHAYKLEHKTYPETLRVLVGKYLKAIPADPFGGGELLRYKRDGKSYLLWSIGPDGIDNGGKAISHAKDVTAERRNRPPVVMPESKGDYVWGKNQ